MRYFLAITCVILSLLLVHHIPNAVLSEPTVFNGVSVTLSNDVKLTTFSLSGLVQTNNSLVFTISAYFNARGGTPNIKLAFDGDNSLSITEAYANTVLYYVGASKNMFIGSYYHSISINTIRSTEAVLFDVDFSSEAENVLSYFKSTAPDLSIDNVGFDGRIFIQARFDNSTGVISHEGFLSFPITLTGNITSGSIDITIPDEYNFQDYKLDGKDMTKIFPNRVQENVETDGNQVSKLYLEWQIPETPPAPQFYDIAPWKWLIPALIGICLTILVKDIFLPRLRKYIRKGN